MTFSSFTPHIDFENIETTESDEKEKAFELLVREYGTFGIIDSKNQEILFSQKELEDILLHDSKETLVEAKNALELLQDSAPEGLVIMKQIIEGDDLLVETVRTTFSREYIDAIMRVVWLHDAVTKAKHELSNLGIKRGESVNEEIASAVDSLDGFRDSLQALIGEYGD